MSRVDFTADLRVLFKFPTWRAYHMILLYFDLWQMNLCFFYTIHQYLQQIAERYQWLSPIGYLFLIIRFMRRVEYYLSNLRRDWLGSGLSTRDRFPLVVNLAGNLDTFIFWFVTDESLLFLYNSSVSSANCWTLPMIKPYWILVFDNQIYEESGVLFVQPPSGLTRIGIIHSWPFPLSCEPCRESCMTCWFNESVAFWLFR